MISSSLPSILYFYRLLSQVAYFHDLTSWLNVWKMHDKTVEKWMISFIFIINKNTTKHAANTIEHFRQKWKGQSL